MHADPRTAAEYSDAVRGCPGDANSSTRMSTFDAHPVGVFTYILSLYPGASSGHPEYTNSGRGNSFEVLGDALNPNHEFYLRWLSRSAYAADTLLKAINLTSPSVEADARSCSGEVAVSGRHDDSPNLFF
jgi:hypothetical protein